MSESKFCAGCLRSEEQNIGKAWCCDCVELVCRAYSAFHKKLSHPHKVIPIKKVQNLSSSLLKISKHCEFHDDQKIVLFCCQHDKLVCDSCFTESHQNCTQVISIEKAAQGVKRGTAVGDLEKRMEKLTRIMKHLLEVYSRGEQNLVEQRTNIRKTVSDIKTKIISLVEKLEVDFNKELDIKLNECNEQSMKNKSTMQQKYDTLKTWKSDLDSLKDTASNVHLFHAIKYLDVKTHKEETAIRNVKTNSIIPKLTFTPSEQISKIREILPSLGILAMESSSIPIPSDLDIDQQGQVFVGGERSNIQLSRVASFETSKLGDGVMIDNGCFVPGNKLLLCASYGDNVYLCDHDGSNTKTIYLDYNPYDVTLYDRNTALVAVRDEGIQIIDLKTLKPGKRIIVGSCCFGITSLNGKIWVKSDTNTLTMIDIKGKVQKEVTTSFNPCCICPSKDDNIYCTDGERDNVYVVTPDGKERVVYSSPDLRYPYGITVDDHGDVYISGYYSNNIHRIYSDGKQSHIILTEEDDIKYPSELSFNNQTKELMVVNKDRNQINIYEAS